MEANSQFQSSQQILGIQGKMTDFPFYHQPKDVWPPEAGQQLILEFKMAELIDILGDSPSPSSIVSLGLQYL